MLSILTTFRDSIKYPLYRTLQLNSIRSWQLLRPLPEILVMGNDPGVKELCQETSVRHIPDIDCSESGVPFLSSMLKTADKLASNNLLLFVSEDIILFNDSMRLADIMSVNPHLSAVVRKRGKEISHLIDFNKRLWQIDVVKNAMLLQACSGDYFMYSKGYWQDVPNYVIGRAICDNWMFSYGNHRKSMVDASDLVTIIHQDHEKYETNGRGQDLINNPDFQHNFTLFNNDVLSKYDICSIDNTNWQILNNEIVQRIL